MWAVVVSLGPATLIAFYLFGVPAVRVVLVTVLACMVSEEVACRIRKMPSTLGDGSAAVTGVLLALTLPPAAPTWMCVIGAMFAILVAKQVFGGLGFNPFNPAIAGRVFLLISFPYPMTAVWPGIAPALTMPCSSTVPTVTSLDWYAARKVTSRLLPSE